MRAKLTTQGALLSSFSSDLEILSLPSTNTLERSFNVYSFSLKKKQKTVPKKVCSDTVTSGWDGSDFKPSGSALLIVCHLCVCHTNKRLY